jgi:hypothetical protein
MSYINAIALCQLPPLFNTFVLKFSARLCQLRKSCKEQIDYYISGKVKHLLRNMEYPDEQKQQLATEISTLIGYSTKIFTLKPRTAIFEYSLTLEE